MGAAVLVVVLSVQAGAEEAQPVSYFKQIVPILNASCAGCHKPDKTKGDLDLTAHALTLKGGKHGKTVVPGKPQESELYKQISGDPPDMPDEGDPLKKEEIELIRQWIVQGAKDDTPQTVEAPVEPPVYPVPPVITAMQFSPDDSVLAVAGYHEILLHKADGSGLIARLVGPAPRVESLAFSKDGKLLAACGGAPAQFGHVQVWDPAQAKLLKSYKIGYDSLYGISFAPDSKSVAFGAADKAVRRIDIETGQSLLDFKAHADWVFGTTFTLDGKQLVSAGRDQAMKLINLENQQFIDDINNPREKIVSFTRHPTQEQVAYGGHLGTPRIYKISDNQQRTAGRNDTNLVREFERQNGAAHSVAFSPDGAVLAVGSLGQVRAYNVADGKLLWSSTLFEGPVYALAWRHDGKGLAAAGFDGQVRLLNPADGQVLAKFVPVPIGRVAAAPVGKPDEKAIAAP